MGFEQNYESMASALANLPLDHVWNNHKVMKNGDADHDQSRYAGHSAFERPQTLRSLTTNETAFPTFAWNSGNSIWHPGSKSSFDTSSDVDDQGTNKDGSPTRTSRSSVSSEETKSFQTSGPWTSRASSNMTNRQPGPVTSPVRQRFDDMSQSTTTTSVSLSKSGLLLGSNPDVEPFEPVGQHGYGLAGKQAPNPWDSIREFRPSNMFQPGNVSSWNTVSKDNAFGRQVPSNGSHLFSNIGLGPFSASQKNEPFRSTTSMKNAFPPVQTASALQLPNQSKRFLGYPYHGFSDDKEILSSSLNNLNLGAERQASVDGDTYLYAHHQAKQRRLSPPNPFLHDPTGYDRWNVPSGYRAISMQTPLDAQNSVPSTRSGHSADGKSASPLASEFRSRMNTPHFASSITPPTGPDSRHSNSGCASSFRGSHPNAMLLEQRLRNLEAQNESHPLRGPSTVFQSSHGHEFDCTPMANTLRSLPYHDPQVVEQHLAVQYDGRPDMNQVTRSPILEDFRVNHKTKRYELKDIFGHVVEFSGDQQGSRFLQTKLETANSDEKEQIFSEVASDSLQLMTDLFGNYVIQKLFEHGNQSQKKMLANHMRGHIYALSMQPYGCRVVQKALEHILTDQQASLIRELDGHVLKVVENQNGNHVIQKAIERIPGEHIQFIVEAHRGHVYELSKHAYGCRVIQRMLEHCQPPAKRLILDELQQNIGFLIKDSFGNYVVQHVIVNGEARDRKPVIELVQADLFANSKHKFASNVVEKAIDYADEAQRDAMLQQLTTSTDHYGQTHVLELLKDQYGNYVIQKCLSHLRGAPLQNLIYQVEQYLTQLRRVSNGKQVTALSDSIRDARVRLQSSLPDGHGIHLHHQWC